MVGGVMAGPREWVLVSEPLQSPVTPQDSQKPPPEIAMCLAPQGWSHCSEPRLAFFLPFLPRYLHGEVGFEPVSDLKPMHAPQKLTNQPLKIHITKSYPIAVIFKYLLIPFE